VRAVCAQLQNALDIHDEQATGSLSKPNVGKLLDQMGLTMSTVELEAAFEAMREREQGHVQATLRAAFDSVDLGGEGFIGTDKVAEVTDKLGAVAELQAAAQVELVHSNSDGAHHGNAL
jgi:Ca2+-binding EF-hand superfamily protein